ncbi:MAG TPA: sigma-70 family RNA polymerase sigma factor [Abditibacteriaceae bacterium]|jgi:RNA polymerase primary sigma factor
MNDTDFPSLLREPRVQQLLKEGAHRGEVSYHQINELLGDLQIDELAAEELFEALEHRAINVVEELAPEDADGIVMPKAKPTPKPKIAPSRPTSNSVSPGAAASAPKKKSDDDELGDLDEVLASLEEFMNSPLGELLARDDAHAEGVRESEKGGEEAPVGAEIEDSYSQYLHRMAAIPLMEAEEELRWAKLAREGSEREQLEAKQKLVEANWRLVVSLARKYQGRASLPLLDIVQEGNIGLVRAVERYNPERGQRLASYASWYIRDSINHAIAAQARSIRLPGHLSAAMQKLQRVQREQVQVLGRDPHPDELAAAASMTPEQVYEILRLVAEPISFETPLGSDESSRLGEHLADEEQPGLLQDISKETMREALEVSLELLAPRERAVIEQRFALGDYESGGTRTVDQISATMHLSRDRVRELEIRALRKMRRRTRGTVLEGIFEYGDEE